MEKIKGTTKKVERNGGTFEQGTHGDESGERKEGTKVRKEKERDLNLKREKRGKKCREVKEENKK